MFIKFRQHQKQKVLHLPILNQSQINIHLTWLESLSVFSKAVNKQTSVPAINTQEYLPLTYIKQHPHCNKDALPKKDRDSSVICP